tara:strand:- start:2379 stop:3122 length:744 start_codon:yes stop_codon:yes gene_type:complete
MTFKKQNPISGSLSIECEKEGLELLHSKVPKEFIKVPHIIAVDDTVLELEKIESVPPTADNWERLGKGLALLHRVNHPEFGFHRDNFIGLNPQSNHLVQDWGLFFVEKRLLFQAHLIKEQTLKEELVHILKNMLPHIQEFLNQHHPHPSLVHGDLWSGNVMFSSEGPWLIDPAVYYGDREVDLAMTRVFGGFAPEFYSAYEKELPLSEGFESRAPIYNMYHYLNHYNLFGSSYWKGVEDGIRALKNI